MLTRIECLKIPVICQVVHFIEQGIIKRKYLEFAYELLQIIFKQTVNYTEKEVYPLSKY